EAIDRRRDVRFRRPALSAQVCLAERDLARLRQEQDAENRLAGVGGDRNRVYFLRGEIHRLEEVAGEARGALGRAGGPLPCSEPRVAEVARCLDLGPERARADEGCADEEIDALVRSVR
ncbi:MAG TPA: hypothetical protein VFP65_19375, partial [Anaeromyxobacteraceae bacterium]|nr:hypothetical protein [Anaeromyxobacteraceae bacterium]